MKKLLVLFVLFLCVGLASGGEKLPPEEQTLTIFLDDVSKGTGLWMNEQVLGQLPISITIVYKGRAVLYESTHVHKKLPYGTDRLRKLTPSFKLVPVPKPDVKLDLNITPELMEKYGKKK